MVLNGENMNVGVWYRAKYPTDGMGERINPEVTFGKLWDCLKSGGDFYGVSGAEDSLVRERLFVKLSEIFRVSYDYIYGMWIAGG